MRLIVVRCDAPDVDVSFPAEVVDMSAIPTRQEMKVLDQAATEILPVDPTPSLEEISSQPDVEHLGEPQFAPQQPDEELRIVVVGTDAALSAVVTRMMRSDYLWATVGYVPLDPSSPAATAWSLPADRTAAFQLAVHGSVRPVPTIRTDQSIVVVGSATITSADGGTLDGEVIVDDETLIFPEKVRNESARFYGQFGVRLVPMVTAPGIAAVRMTTSAVAEEPPTGFRARLGSWLASSMTPAQVQAWSETKALKWFVEKAPVRPGGVDERSLLTGRAVQCGGLDVLVTIDGVPAKRPVKRVTFYRHLRDMQVVRI